MSNAAQVGILVPIVFFISAFTMIIFVRRFINAERMAMIEKGLNPFTSKPNRINPSVTLRFALLAIGAGTGILFGNLLATTTRISEEVAFFSMILIFGGLGLLASYVLELRMFKEQQVRQRTAPAEAYTLDK